MADKRRTISDLFAQLAKAMQGVPTDKLDDIREVPDMWNDQGEHEAPSAAQINTGPAESMRGGNAIPMVGRHSDGAPQTGMTELYARFEGILSDMKKAIGQNTRQIGSVASVVNDLVKHQSSVTKAIEALAEETKPAPEMKAEPLDEDSFLGKAVGKIAKAQKIFRKSELEDEELGEVRKTFLTDAAALLKAAKRLLAKAEDEDLAKADDEIMEKAVSDVRALNARVEKAIGEITKAEDEKEDEKKKEKESEESAKAEPVAAKAEDEKESSAKEEKEDDTAKKAEEVTKQDLDAMLEQVKSAVEGRGAVLETTVKDFMNLFSQASRPQVPPSFMMKADQMATLESIIDDAKDNGTLVTPTDAIKADTLMHHLKLMQAGTFPRDRFANELAAAPSNIRNLFQTAA